MKKTVSSLVVTSCMTAFRKRVRLRRAGLGHLVDPFGGTLLNVACKPLYKSLSSTNLFGLTFYRTNHAPYMAKGHEASTNSERNSKQSLAVQPPWFIQHRELLGNATSTHTGHPDHNTAAIATRHLCRAVSPSKRALAATRHRSNSGDETR